MFFKFLTFFNNCKEHLVGNANTAVMNDRGKNPQDKTDNACQNRKSFRDLQGRTHSIEDEK